jgi:hypothetical protein
MLGLKIEGLAAGAGDVAQRQQHFGRGQIFAGAPIDPRAVGTVGDESLDQRCFTGPGLGRNGDDPASARARMRERVTQTPQLFFALQQLDGRLPVVPSRSL